jgi:hypothetical protein
MRQYFVNAGFDIGLGFGLIETAVNKYKDEGEPVKLASQA